MFPENESKLRALESALTHLRGVRSARVEPGSSGGVRVRVLVVPERSTASIIRQTESLMTRFGFTPDPHNIEVLRVAEALLPTGQVRRRKLSSLSTHRGEGRFGARVVLELGGDVLIGESDLPATAPIEYRLIAEAVIGGLQELIDDEVTVESVEMVHVGESRFAVVSVQIDSRPLVGSAIAVHDEHDAIARAVLDALNRLVGRAALEFA